MDEAQKKAMVQLALAASKAAFEASMAVQTQVLGSVATALLRKKLLTGDEVSAMLTHAADGLSFGVKKDPSHADISADGLKTFIEGLLELAERSRSNDEAN